MPSETRGAALLLGALAVAASARTPSIPEWAQLEVTPAEGVELGRPARFEVRLRAVLGPVTATPPRVEVRGGAVLAGPMPAEGARLEAGETMTWTLRVRLDRPAGASAVAVELPATCPREALVAAAAAVSPDAGRAARDEMAARIRALPERPVLTAQATPWLTESEGWLDGQGPRFTHYSPPDALGTSFALWKPARKKGEGAARSALASASPRLRALLQQSGVSRGPDDGSQAYLDLLEDLGRVPDPVLGQRADELATRAAPEVATAAATLAAVAAARAGRWGPAVEAFEHLVNAPGMGPYGAYNLAEALVAAGEPARAREAYRQALSRRPVFTRARRRLRELEGREP